MSVAQHDYTWSNLETQDASGHVTDRYYHRGTTHNKIRFGNKTSRGNVFRTVYLSVKGVWCNNCLNNRGHTTRDIV